MAAVFLTQYATEIMLTDNELLRYSRHILLNGIDASGQLALRNSEVLVLGAGGLGSATLMYLAASGVGHIVVSDPDAVELSNLQRQIAHNNDRIRQNKAESARHQMLAQNPEIAVTPIPEALVGAGLEAAVRSADVVVVGTDTLGSRLNAMAACLSAATPLVHGAAIGWEGQLSVFQPADAQSPCLGCLYPNPDNAPTLNCAESGVISPLVGVMGSFQALETLKLLTGAGKPAVGQLLIFDALQAEWHRIRVPRSPTCPLCGAIT